MNDSKKNTLEALKEYIEKEYETVVDLANDDITFDVKLDASKYGMYCLLINDLLIIHLFTGIIQQPENIEIIKFINKINDSLPAGVVSGQPDEEIVIKTHLLSFEFTDEKLNEFNSSMGLIFANVERFLAGISSVNSRFSTAESAQRIIFSDFQAD
ncbi:hypothetical protein [Comamonas jiangduensis]|uniref:Uncharacterized protein n=1 Tax=Comamonas jiangduensis TaxID=1194168 RepID=A0ABV4IGA8_9BURK